MKNKVSGARVAGVLTLLLTAIIWGSAFAAQDAAGEHLQPFTFNASRAYIAAVALAAACPVFDRARKDGRRAPGEKILSRREMVGGALCGLFLFVSVNLQQAGLAYTSVSKAGFLSTLYIVFVPIVGLFFRRRVRPAVWMSVVLALVGVYLLSVTKDFSINRGDALCLGCAACFTGHILMVDRMSGTTDSVRLSAVQFFVMGTLSLVCALLFESVTWGDLRAALFPILYVGLFSGAVAYTLQIVGQRMVEPSVASILMSMESVFAAFFGVLLRGDRLSVQEWIGCAVLFGAVLLSQIEFKKKKSTDS